MANFFRNLGKALGPTVHRANWIRLELVGTEDEAVEAEYRFGRDLARAFAKEQPPDSSVKTSDQLNAVAERLTSCVRNRKRQFTFFVLSTPKLNAYALPGGFIYVTELLLLLFDRKHDHLAFVLAHEMAHIIRGHARDRVLNNALLSTLSLTAPASGAWHALSRRIAREFLNSTYSQEQELEADELAIRLSRAAGFKPAAAIDALQQLEQLQGDKSSLSDYFSSHPPTDRRIARMKRLIGG